ncbi:ATP-binding protein [Nocardioides ultimimeridianus]
MPVVDELGHHRGAGFGQIAIDAVSRAPQSDWGRRFAEVRITQYDGIRPFVSRAALVIVLGTLLLPLPGHHLLGLLLLAPAAAQVSLELLLEPVVRARSLTQSGTEGLLGTLARPWFWNYERGLTNITGIVGAAACLCLLVEVVYNTGSGSQWQRVAALAVGTGYAISGLNSVVCDTAVYSPRGDRLPQALRALMPFAWLFALGLVLINVIIAQAHARVWGDAFPYAVMATLLLWCNGQRFRDHTRDLQVGAVVAADRDRETGRRAATDLHNLLQAAKGPLQDAEMTVPNPQTRAALVLLRLDLEAVYTSAHEGTLDLAGGLVPPVTEHLSRLCRGAVLPLRTDIALDDVPDADRWLARQSIMLLTKNAVDGYTSGRIDWVERGINVQARFDGRFVTIAVRDGLPSIPDAVWQRDDTTLSKLRGDAHERGGSLTQTADSSGKTIVVTWPVALAPLRDQGRR